MTRSIPVASLPAKADLQPIWEFIYIFEALLALVGTAQGLFVARLQGFVGIFGS